MTDTGRYGPYFALAVVDGPGWQPFPGDLAGRVEQTRAELERRVGHPVGRRVAASLAHLDLAARLLSPALALAGTAAGVPDLRPANVRWRPRPGGAPPLAVVDATLHPVARLDELVIATVRAVGVGLVASRHVRDGNVASAIASAGRLCPPAEPVARALLATWEPTSPEPHGFRRTSCCLYYHADPRAGVCGDCVLAGRGGRAAG